MIETLLKFPSTPHLAVLPGASVRDDKVLSEKDRHQFLSQSFVVEEKIDGSNLGISFDSHGNILAQNRGSYIQLPAAGQWKKLNSWILKRQNQLFDVLIDRYILFGEWCYVKHSIHYDKLPDWFVGFDLFDSQVGKFVNSSIRNKFFQQMDISSVPHIATGTFSLNELENLMSISSFGQELSEGIYLRVDDSRWLVERAKLVRPDFIQSIDDHWSRLPIKTNCRG